MLYSELEVTLASPTPLADVTRTHVCDDGRVPIDEFMPTWEVSEVHRVEVAADPGSTFRALLALDLSESRLARLLYRVRGLPDDALTWEGALRMGFVRLAVDADRELVHGLVGRFWTLRGGIVDLDPEEFAAYDEPGHVKAVWSFRIDPVDGRTCVLTTETRVRATDAAARRRFRPYWLAVRPFSGLIRRAMLRSIKRAAEAA